MVTGKYPLKVSTAFLLSSILCLVIAGCDSGGNGGSGDDNLQKSELSRFAGCEELRTYLIKTAKIQAALQQAYGYGVPEVGFSPGGSPTADTGYGGTEGLAYTNTNVQEEGVDEPDLIKTDGDFIYLVSGGYFMIISAWPPSGAAELSRYKLNGYPLGLFVYEDTAVVFSYYWNGYDTSQSFAPRTYESLVITVLDVSDRAAPAPIREISLEGRYLDARMVEGRVHLLLYSQLYIYQSPYAWAEAGSSGGGTDDLNIEDLLPKYRDRKYSSNQANDSEAMLAGCLDVYQPDDPNGTATITLLTLDLGAPLGDLKSVSVLGNGGTVYASKDSMYIASARSDYWVWGPTAEGRETEPGAWTNFHRFSLGAAPAYTGSGGVEGYVLNQFSMSQSGGNFRVATTVPRWLSDSDSPKNALYVLSIGDSVLDVVGSVTGLGKPGETIMAVRFIGDKGYVVTFEQKDPLYVIDLANPLDPKKAGELEVPGFSTYLHPMADGRLLAVGRNPENSGTDLSIFDVSDPMHPSLATRTSLGANSYSDAEYDHKAFSYFPSRGVLAVPFSKWPSTFYGGDYYTGLGVFKVDPASGFTRLGSVEHSEFYKDYQYSYYYAGVKRSLFIGDEGSDDYIYSMSDRGLKANPLADLTVSAASVALPFDYPMPVAYY